MGESGQEDEHLQLYIFIVHCTANKGGGDGLWLHSFSLGDSREEFLSPVCGQTGIHWLPCGVVPGSLCMFPCCAHSPGRQSLSALLSSFLWWVLPEANRTRVWSWVYTLACPCSCLAGRLQS